MAESAWALLPSVLNEMGRALNLHARLPGADAAGGLSPMSVVNGTAVIEVEGVLHRGSPWISRFYGGTNLDTVHGALQAALADPNVRSILFYIDSPGGGISGLQELAGAIREARTRKPVTAWTDGLMASGAYWLASAAGRVFISGDTTMVGSIGVVSRHVDVRKAEEQRGFKTTEIYAGKYKTLGSPHQALSADARAQLQERVDALYRVFVDDVAAGRRTTSRAVLDRMADGRLFIGRAAIDAGLVDGVRSLEETFADLR